MIFIRLSSRLLFLRTATHRRLEEYLIKNLDGKKVTLSDALVKTSEESTVVFITPEGLQATKVEDAVSIVHISLSTTVILMQIINEGKTRLLNKAQLGPGLLIMRIPEKGQGVIERIKEEYNGSILSFGEGISRGESEDTLIAFTDRPINRYAASIQKEPPFLLVNVPVTKMQGNIRRDAVRYITESLTETQWYEYRINIYDAHGRYMQHFERLMLVFSDLETGFVLGQRWTRDHALVLYSVTAYQVRIFSLMPPQRLKKLLVGLEYDGQGNRFVDLDLYYRNKKVEFSSVEKGIKKEERPRVGAKMRESILAGLSKDILGRLLKTEEGLERRAN